MSSKQQQKLCKLIESILPNVKYQQDVRPDLLKNSLTNKNLEIDIFLEDFKIGIEYQGAIHFNNISRYKNDSDNSRLYDIQKMDKVIKSLRVPLALIEIFETDIDTSDFRQMFLTRITNTQSHYYLNRHFFGCYLLERLKFYAVHGLDIADYKYLKRGLFRRSANTYVNDYDLSSLNYYYKLSDLHLFSLKEKCKSNRWFKVVYEYAKTKNTLDIYEKVILKDHLIGTEHFRQKQLNVN